jgi:hypothetical protein
MRRARLLPSAVVVSLLALPAAAAAAPAPKFDLCHRTGDGTYQPISISANATRAHLAHGDVLQPNGVVPGESGFVFDSQCQVVSWTYAVNVAPDASAQDPGSPGNLYVGSGIPATNFGTATNAAAGIELGMMVLYRQGPNVVSTDNYDDGILEFDVASGPQSTANGSFADNAARAAWNYTFSVATGLGGATTTLADFTFQLLVDVDPGPGTSFRTLQLEAEGTPQLAGQSGFAWRDLALNAIVMPDDEGTANVTQNSQNYAFPQYQAFLTAPYGPGSTFSGPAQFDLVLQAFAGTQLVARNHVAVNVASPAP